MADVYQANNQNNQNGGNNKNRPIYRGGVTPPEDPHSSSGHTHNPLASFCMWPDNMGFETQEHGERVILLLRQHPITNIPWILMTLILIAAPLLLPYFPILAFFPAKFQYIAILFWYLIVTAFALEKALSWFFNVYFVTSERIIDVDFDNLIYHQISDAEIIKIQDVTYSVGGVVRTLFNYGDVFIQTAGEVNNFEFLAVPNPAEVVKLLEDLRIEDREDILEEGKVV